MSILMRRIKNLKTDKKTIIVFYVYPAGNTIEMTIEKQTEDGDDWHYDIRHIGAQTRFLRNTLKDKNIITVYLQTTDNAWQLYDDYHSNDGSVVQPMATSILTRFSDVDYKVILNSHS
ncbi:MAG: hypothetical protein J7M01_01375, partial [Candidatus Marinimicrobia bacterium]|nr:hypothetical protein [Candidatus Neomarinimicrobiota bacterium]